MNNLFRGWIMKNWVNAGIIQPKKIHTLNKLIIKQSITFYSEVWRYRNEVRHDP